jgi:hypothetical protein
MTKTITHVYYDYAAADQAVRNAKAAGLGDSHISIVASNAEGWHKPGSSNVNPLHDKDRDGKDDRAEGAATGGGMGAIAGGAAGVAAGLGMLAIPGIGPVVAAGWLVATALGAGVGAGAGGLLGSLAGLAGKLLGGGHGAGVAQLLAIFGKLGLSTEQITGFITAAMALLKDKLPPELFAKIQDQIPGLTNLLGGEAK